MTERPILFSSPMVRAIHADRKTQTRRVVDPRSFAGKWLADCEFGLGLLGACEYVADRGNYPPYVAGMRLWVKETWAVCDADWHVVPPGFDLGNGEGLHTIYRCDHVDLRGDADPIKWRSPLFMPRWASRLTLEVTRVRVERLQALSTADAMAEGIPQTAGEAVALGLFPEDGPGHEWDNRTSVENFAALWERINGKRDPWDSNPFVWSIAFKRTAPEQQPALEVAQ